HLADPPLFLGHFLETGTKSAHEALIHSSLTASIHDSIVAFGLEHIVIFIFDHTRTARSGYFHDRLSRHCMMDDEAVVKIVPSRSHVPRGEGALGVSWLCP